MSATGDLEPKNAIEKVRQIVQEYEKVHREPPSFEHVRYTFARTGAGHLVLGEEAIDAVNAAIAGRHVILNKEDRTLTLSR